MWDHHFHAPTEKEVRKAPARIGYLVELQWDVRMMVFSDKYAGEELEQLKEIIVEVREIIGSEVREVTKRNGWEDLQLRSNGSFVRVIAERYPVNAEGPVS